jgi:hypothetical protein
MARIAGAPLNQSGLLPGLFVGMVDSFSRRRLGHVVMPAGDGAPQENSVRLRPDGAVAALAQAG